uniref:Uncharacterized protein n=1 Tax=Nicotiana tabacum TaxID=4097 RepID=A0A1S3ZE91_TOBAC|nr:PREDICTED: uncharacterized protein LOC107785873 [Nicotiana tabacum]
MARKCKLDPSASNIEIATRKLANATKCPKCGLPFTIADSKFAYTASQIQSLPTLPNLSNVIVTPQMQAQPRNYERVQFTAKFAKISASWDNHLSLIEFAYNNRNHAIIEIAPSEALYGRPDLVNQEMEKVKIIKKRLKTALSHQMSYSDIRHRDLEFKVDELVFLNVFPM